MYVSTEYGVHELGFPFFLYGVRKLRLAHPQTLQSLNTPTNSPLSRRFWLVLRNFTLGGVMVFVPLNKLFVSSLLFFLMLCLTSPSVVLLQAPQESLDEEVC